MEFVPMIWGVKHGSASGDNRDIDREIANLDTTAGSVLLGYNEPDGDNLKSQSHIDVKTVRSRLALYIMEGIRQYPAKSMIICVV